MKSAKKGTSTATRVTLLALFLTFTAIAVTLVVTGEGNSSSQAAESELSAPELLAREFTLENGDTGTLSDFDGEPVVVNFFASWCAPCRAELPDFEQVHQETKDQVTFLGVSHDISQDSWQDFVEQTDISFQTVYQPDQLIWTDLKAFSLPATAFIGADGKVKHLHSGVLDQSQLTSLIAEHLTTESITNERLL